MWGAWLLRTLKAEQTKYFASILMKLCSGG